MLYRFWASVRLLPVLCILAPSVFAHAPKIGLSLRSIDFKAAKDGAKPANVSVVLANETHGRMPFVLNITTNTGGNWLSATPARGLLPGFSDNETVNISISASQADLAPGFYRGQVTVAANGDATSYPASNSPQTISVSFLVTGDTPILKLSTGALSFQEVSGLNRTITGSVDVSNGGTGTLNWTATAETTTGGNWLSISPASGTGAATIKVQAKPGTLAPGAYSGRIKVTSGTSQQTVDVTYTLRPPKPAELDASPRTLSFSATAGNVSPAPKTIAIANLGEAPLSWRATVATFNGGAWLSVGSETGTAPANLQVSAALGTLPSGTYAGRVTVTVNDGPAAFQIPVTFNVLRQRPALDGVGLVHTALQGPAPGAPGQLASIYGLRLGPPEPLAPDLDPSRALPVELAGTRVTLDGVPAALLLVSDTQVNFQIPFEVAGKTEALLRVEVTDLDPIETTVALRDSSVGIFTRDGTNALALNDDGSANSQDNPARPGSTLSLFLSGQGSVDPPVATGAAAPSQPPFSAPVLPVQVKIGAQDAKVVTAVLAPGQVGITRVDAEVPASLSASGRVQVDIQIGDSRNPKPVYVFVSPSTGQ